MPLIGKKEGRVLGPSIRKAGCPAVITGKTYLALYDDSAAKIIHAWRYLDGVYQATYATKDYSALVSDVQLLGQMLGQRKVAFKTSSGIASWDIDAGTLVNATMTSPGYVRIVGSTVYSARVELLAHNRLHLHSGAFGAGGAMASAGYFEDPGVDMSWSGFLISTAGGKHLAPGDNANTVFGATGLPSGPQFFVTWPDDVFGNFTYSFRDAQACPGHGAVCLHHNPPAPLRIIMVGETGLLTYPWPTAWAGQDWWNVFSSPDGSQFGALLDLGGQRSIIRTGHAGIADSCQAPSFSVGNGPNGQAPQWMFALD